MNKVHRNHIDIGVAFSSGAKRQSDNMLLSNGMESDPDIGNPHDSKKETMQSPLRPRIGIKTVLRPIAQLAYRIIKPVLRPVAFRIRRYFIDGMRQEIAQEYQRTCAATFQEVQAIRESLRQEFQWMSAGTLQEVQAARESLRRELQRISAGTHQGPRDSFSELIPRLERIEQYSCTSARRVAINCGQGEVLVRTEVGYVLCAASDHAVLACLIETGELEPGTRILIQRLLKPGDVFIDVGANLGMHTIAGARAMQGVGKIIAFEPFEPTKRLLEKSIWMNGFAEMTEIHQAAVSNISGHQRLFVGATSGHHSLFPLDTPAELSSEPVDVPLVRLDEVILAGQKVDLIKIDAEGAELEVLESGVSVIKNNPDIALIVEFGPSHLKRTSHSTQQWLENFTELDLYYRVINSSTGALEDWSLAQLERIDSVNLLFARKDSLVWAKATA